ncbi:MAG: methionyl-tRNA formyltransferase [Epsilonproteobacteria bacterium]|nr:methionyl-tRNA formyltransferase [Campylobacterota bacterium]
MKVIFMGTPSYADMILQKMVAQKDIDVVAVFTQPDKPVGRKKLLTPPPVKVTAEQHNIPVYQPNRLRDAEAIKDVLNIACHYIVVAAYGQILPRKILDHAPCINLHASILPQYRGASPIQQTLLNGDSKTGVTAMVMDEGLDTGDIIKIKKIDVADDEMVESLFARLTEVAADLTIEVLQEFENLEPKKQDESKATHCKKITKADGLVVFDDAKVIFNKYRAFTPWPGVYLESGLKLKKMALTEDSSGNDAGEILAINKNSITVGCQKGSLEIFVVQPPSKKEMDALGFVNGQRIGVADTLS